MAGTLTGSARTAGSINNANAAYDAHIADKNNPHSVNASQVPNTPAGNIAATNVQDAINELDTKKAANGANTDIISLSGTEMTADPTTPLGIATKQYVDRVPLAALAALNGKAILLATDTDLQVWADGLPASGLYNIKLTVAQGALSAGWWYIEYFRHVNDTSTNLHHFMRATSLNTTDSLSFINTCMAGTWSGWVHERGLYQARQLVVVQAATAVSVPHATWTQAKLDNAINNVGGLTTTTYGVTTPSWATRAVVSGSYAFQSVTSGDGLGGITINSVPAGRPRYVRYPSSNYATFGIPPIHIAVTSGDVVGLRVYQTSGATVSTRTGSAGCTLSVVFYP